MSHKDLVMFAPIPSAFNQLGYICESWEYKLLHVKITQLQK